MQAIAVFPNNISQDIRDAYKTIGIELLIYNFVNTPHYSTPRATFGHFVLTTKNKLSRPSWAFFVESFVIWFSCSFCIFFD